MPAFSFYPCIFFKDWPVTLFDKEKNNTGINLCCFIKKNTKILATLKKQALEKCLPVSQWDASVGKSAHHWPWQPEFNPQNPHGREEPAPSHKSSSYSHTSIFAPWHTCTDTHISLWVHSHSDHYALQYNKLFITINNNKTFFKETKMLTHCYYSVRWQLFRYSFNRARNMCVFWPVEVHICKSLKVKHESLLVSLPLICYDIDHFWLFIVDINLYFNIYCVCLCMQAGMSIRPSAYLGISSLLHRGGSGSEIRSLGLVAGHLTSPCLADGTLIY